MHMALSRLRTSPPNATLSSLLKGILALFLFFDSVFFSVKGLSPGLLYSFLLRFLPVADFGDFFGALAGRVFFPEVD